MIKPINGHLLVRPVAHETFISSAQTTFQEIAIIMAVPTNGYEEITKGLFDSPKIGDKIYFDSWLIAKYPDGKDGELWLVKWSDVRAIETNDTIPE